MENFKEETSETFDGISICRACLKDNRDVTNILNDDRLLQDFYFITNIKIQNGFPCGLCPQCNASLRNAAAFRYMCRKADGVLNDYFSAKRIFNENTTLATYIQNRRSDLPLSYLEDTVIPNLSVIDPRDSGTKPHTPDDGIIRSIVSSPYVGRKNGFRSCRGVYERGVKAEGDNGSDDDGMDQEGWFPEAVDEFVKLDHVTENDLITKGQDVCASNERLLNLETDPVESKEYVRRTRSKRKKANVDIFDDNKLNADTTWPPFDQTDYHSMESEDLLASILSENNQTPRKRTKKSKRKKKNGERKPKGDRKTAKEAKGKKELREGFSSRMVLETEQYKVIKLTKAQLIEEMQVRGQSERYINSPFKCELCVKGFNYEDVLQNHNAKHVQSPGYLECDVCHQFVPSAVSMRGHMKSHSTKYACKACGAVKASRQHLLEHHALSHGGAAARLYVCNHCGKSMAKRTMFQKHMKTHFPRSRIACEKCGKLFKTIETLRAHNLRHADVKQYRCPQCPKAFRYASLLYTHGATHVTQRNFYCVECDMRFKTASNLRLHLRKSLKHVDPETLKHVCAQCPRRYARAASLAAHAATAHGGERPHACAVCARRFASTGALRGHTRRVHGSARAERVHVCSVCGRAFRAKAVLVKHMRVHTGERPFACDRCGRKFAQRSTLVTHVKLVHLKVQRGRAKTTNGDQAGQLPTGPSPQTQSSLEQQTLQAGSVANPAAPAAPTAMYAAQPNPNSGVPEPYYYQSIQLIGPCQAAESETCGE